MHLPKPSPAITCLDGSGPGRARTHNIGHYIKVSLEGSFNTVVRVGNKCPGVEKSVRQSRFGGIYVVSWSKQYTYMMKENE